MAEVGRQPFTVYGLLRTADSVSPVSAEQVALSLLVFVIVYAIAFTAGVFYIWRIAAQGPASDTKPPPTAPRARQETGARPVQGHGRTARRRGRHSYRGGDAAWKRLTFP